jgi:hypothetical protein
MLRTLLLLVTLGTAAFAAASERLDVPRGTAPHIDGRIEEQEWRDAVSVELSAGGHALLKHDGDYVYIAFRAERPGIGSVCALMRGDVHVLHASAALGTAIYTRVDGSWMAAQAFRWSNRDTGENAAAIRDRNRFIIREKWFANAARQAQPEREFQLAYERGTRQLPIALSFLEVEPRTRLTTWPARLTDGCTSVRLAQGFLEEHLQFSPTHWGVLVLGR